MDAIMMALETTFEHTAKPLASRAHAGGLCGDFTTMPLYGVVWWLRDTRRTATVYVESHGLDGLLVFRRGVLGYCCFGELVGVPALEALLAQSQGQFSVQPRGDSVEATLEALQGQAA
jgi:hypothetical protein